MCLPPTSPPDLKKRRIKAYTFFHLYVHDGHYSLYNSLQGPSNNNDWLYEEERQELSFIHKKECVLCEWFSSVSMHPCVSLNFSVGPSRSSSSSSPYARWVVKETLKLLVVCSHPTSCPTVKFQWKKGPIHSNTHMYINGHTLVAAVFSHTITTAFSQESRWSVERHILPHCSLYNHIVPLLSWSSIRGFKWSTSVTIRLLFTTIPALLQFLVVIWDSQSCCCNHTRINYNKSVCYCSGSSCR